MAQSPPKPPQRTIYYGTFIHNISLTELEILENAAIGVDENGNIAFVEKNRTEVADLDRVVEERGWAEYDVVRGDGGGCRFWFPGFVGE